jgi:hypothetical protein
MERELHLLPLLAHDADERFAIAANGKVRTFLDPLMLARLMA